MALDPAASSAGCSGRLASPAALADWRAAFAAALAPTEGGPRLRDGAAYGRREFHVVDPSGNGLRVGAPLGDA